MLDTILDSPLSQWLCQDTEATDHIVISSRIRLARNFDDILFTNINISEYMPEKAGLILSSNTNYIYPDDITGALFTRLLDILFVSGYDKNDFIENVMQY